MKVLATTDFSDNSAAALRFAIQLAEQNPNIELTFFHSYHILRPSSFSDEQFDAYENEKKAEIQKQLETFIDGIYASLNITPKKAEYIIKESVVASGNVINYAEKCNFDLLCIGTRGAGTIEKMLGTNTINIINKCNVPIVAIPVDYIYHSVDKLLYASDFFDLDIELDKVVNFARPLNAKVEVLHFSFPSETADRNSEAKERGETFDGYPISFNIVDNNALKPLVANLENYVESTHPSLLVMFTNPN
ncbi:universal stress protein, partial [Pseudoxanthomonas sp. SGD-10]